MHLSVGCRLQAGKQSRALLVVGGLHYMTAIEKVLKCICIHRKAALDMVFKQVQVGLWLF